MNTLKGQMLIAAPELADPNFSRTVVLMIEHNDEGAFGLVLNRPSGMRIKDVWKEVTETPCESPQPINVGGPVLGPLLALHGNMAYSESEIMPGVYISSSREHLDEIVRLESLEFRLFSGYAGWGEGQLEGELEAGGWITRPATFEYVFYDGEDLWEKVGADITGSVFSALGIKHVPSDPSLN